VWGSFDLVKVKHERFGRDRSSDGIENMILAETLDLTGCGEGIYDKIYDKDRSVLCCDLKINRSSTATHTSMDMDQDLGRRIKAQMLSNY